MPVAITVRPYRHADHNDTLATAARAFTIDPLFSFFCRDTLHEHRLLPRMMAGYMRDLDRNGTGWIVEHDGKPRAFAGWLAPGALPRSTRREVEGFVLSAPAILRSAHPLKAIRLFTEVERRHPREPHWYLSLLVTDPTLQGRGLGSAVIAPGLAVADDAGMPCYLETQKESNVGWYARQGFELQRTISLPGIPSVWCLWREPR